jgi:hypothetical protein
MLSRIIIVCLAATQWANADHTIYGYTENARFKVALPSSGAASEFRMVEWSTNLNDWEPVVRNYGFHWENIFPHALSVSGGVSQVLLDPTNSEKRFYRMVSSTASVLDNTNSVSRFLQQATFGPTRELINTFPGLDDPNLNEAPYTNYLAWIDAQRLPARPIRTGHFGANAAIRPLPIIRPTRIFMRWGTIRPMATR